MNSIIKKPVSGIHKVLTSFSFRRDWIYLFFVVLAVAAALLLKYAMAWGPWAFSDSAAYISAARNLVAGHGLTVSNPQGGFDPLTLHEPLYLFLTIVSFFAVLYYIRNQNAFMLYLAATLTGLSILTRYIGLSNALCGAVLIFIFLPENSKTSLQWSLLFTGFSILPPAVWLLLGSFEPKQSVRSWQIPTDMFKQFQLFIRQLFETFSDWLPFKKEYQLSTEAIFPLVIILFSAVVILFLAALLIKRNSGNQIENGAAILVFSAGQFILVYLTVFYVAIAISSLPPDVNTRTMVPLLPFLILLLPGLLYFYTIRSRWTILMPLILILSCGWVLSSTRIAAYDLVTNRHLNGHGFTASYWQGSTVLKAARDLSQEIPWISNQPALFLLYLNKFPYDLTTVYPEIIRDG